MDLTGTTLEEIQEAIQAVCIQYILRKDEVSYEIEEWDNGRMNLIIGVPSRISRKVCKSCVGTHFTRWFSKKYPESIIAHVSFQERIAEQE